MVAVLGGSRGGCLEASAAATWMLGVPGLDAGLDWSDDDSESECKVVCGRKTMEIYTGRHHFELLSISG